MTFDEWVRPIERTMDAAAGVAFIRSYEDCWGAATAAARERCAGKCDVTKVTRVLALQTFDKPERTFTASCYLCQTDTGLQMLPHRKEGYLVGWIFACETCAPRLFDAELTSVLKDADNA